MEQLKNFRKIANLNTEEMAKEIGISKSFYEKIELGYKKASNGFIEKLKKRFPFIDVNIFFTI